MDDEIVKVAWTSEIGDEQQIRDMQEAANETEAWWPLGDLRVLLLGWRIGQSGTLPPFEPTSPDRYVEQSDLVMVIGGSANRLSPNSIEVITSAMAFYKELVVLHQGPLSDRVQAQVARIEREESGTYTSHDYGLLLPQAAGSFMRSRAALIIRNGRGPGGGANGVPDL